MEKRSSIYIIRVVPIILVLTFVAGQVSAGQITSNPSNSTLAASVVSDSNINPARSGPVQNDIAEKAEPGAIANGIPLLELAQGKLPDRIKWNYYLERDYGDEIRESINLAIKLGLSAISEKRVPPQHLKRVKDAIDNLIVLRDHLTQIGYLFNADIRGKEDYRVGFNFQGQFGYSIELINRLYGISSKRLAQYIFHECVPEKGITTERDDHRVVYNEIQSAVFGQDEVVALKRDLREFINDMLIASDDRIDALKIVLRKTLSAKHWRLLEGGTEKLIPTSEVNIVFELLTGDRVFQNMLSGQGLSTDVRREVDSINKTFRADIAKLKSALYSALHKKLGVLIDSGHEQDISNSDVNIMYELSRDKDVFEHQEAASSGTSKKATTPSPEVANSLQQPPLVYVPAVLAAQISEDLPVRAQVLKANLTRILTEHTDQLFFIGIETDIGESQKAQIMPIYKAIDEIKELKDAAGKPLFPNLMVRREKAEGLVKIAADLAREGKLNLNNAFIGARKLSVDNKLYDSIKGEGKAWISAIDDSRPGDYLPVFEAITVNMMAYLNADLTAIKNFYDTISDKPIDPKVLQDMLRNRIIYILPRTVAFDTKQLRELYELAHQVYIAA